MKNAGWQDLGVDMEEARSEASATVVEVIFLSLFFLQMLQKLSYKHHQLCCQVFGK